MTADEQPLDRVEPAPDHEIVVETQKRPAGRRVLMTNDDGIESPGLRLLAEELAADCEVRIAAPVSDVSGAGTGIGRFEGTTGVELTPLTDPNTGAALDGPPGLAVMAAALGAFGDPPDLVVSGINAGMNTGHSVIHSGTVGAILTARTFGIPGVAISLAPSEPWEWETAVHVGAAVVRWMLRRPRRDLTLSVNVPGRPLGALRPARWAPLDDFGYFRIANARPEQRRLQFEVTATDSGRNPRTDSALCQAGHVTITPLTGVETAPFPDYRAEEILDGSREGPRG